MTDDWKAAWDRVVAAVGTDFGGEQAIAGADAVEPGLIRRYMEPLEFDCPLHFDDTVAREHGHPGVIAPSSSYVTFAIPPIWRPGEPPVFTKAERDAQPDRVAIAPPSTGLEPPYTGYFATDFEIEFLQPLLLGDRVSRKGNRLVGCDVKETRVGRGAFTKWEWDLLNQRGEPVARMRVSLFLYNPHPASEPDPAAEAVGARG